MGSRSAACRLELARLPGVLAGRYPDPHGHRAKVLTLVGQALLRCIRVALWLKKAGVAGDDGVRWEPRKRAKKGAAAALDTSAVLRQIERSLDPGLLDGRPSRAKGQVFRVEPPRVTVGTEVAPWWHRGSPTTPPRPLWPPSGVVPPAWMPAIREAVREGVRLCVADVIRRYGRMQ